MNENFTVIPCIAVHPDRINIYNEIKWHGPKRRYKQTWTGEEYEQIKYSHLLESDRKAHGHVSKTAKRKIEKAIDYLLLLASDKKVHSLRTGRKFTFKIAFITLTLPSTQIHDDKTIKREALNHFLIQIQRKHKVKNYVWRAEKQKNGNIHFHILIDKFIHWNELRNEWNRIINKLGYVTRYQERMKNFYKDGFKVMPGMKKGWNETKQRQAYKRNLETDFRNPNSTDIHSIRKVRNLQSYFVKYMTKNQDQSPNEQKENTEFMEQTGAVWGASKNLQSIKGAQTNIDSKINEELETLSKHQDVKVYSGTNFTVLFVDYQKLHSKGAFGISKIFLDYLIKHFEHHPQRTILMAA